MEGAAEIRSARQLLHVAAPYRRQHGAREAPWPGERGDRRRGSDGARGAGDDLRYAGGGRAARGRDRIAAAGRTRRTGVVWRVRLRTFGSRVDARHRRRHLQGPAASSARPAERQTGTRCAMNRRVKRVDELRRDIPPARDLWPAIAAAIEADKAVSAAASVTPRRAAWWPAVGLAAS